MARWTNYKKGTGLLERLTTNRLYNIYNHMKARCNNRRCMDFPDYGGRGIAICDEWVNSFQAFHDWSIENGYSPDLTIDRINNDGNYTPVNCRWVTSDIQANNKRIYKTNTSGHPGVYKAKGERKWKVRVSRNGKYIHLGKFNTLHQAIITRQSFINKTT